MTQELEIIVLEKEQLETIKFSGGRLFVLTAGMLNEFTPAHDLALRMIPDPRQAVFFVGYADPDTPGGRLKASKAGQPFLYSAGAGELTRRCEVQDFDLTAHANREALLEFAGKVSPRVILLGHGEHSSRQWFEQQLRLRLPQARIVQPAPGLVVEAENAALQPPSVAGKILLVEVSRRMRKFHASAALFFSRISRGNLAHGETWGN